ncbi:T9SS type A sorting domain-containing protein [Leeuwenhoekiella sp. H156]|uniref:T9SS type A sorting domain-containing protein n=1 Tax=Leeuwenhoekiella sp. H156 TaxID=3450128 RepID=UPI003FA42DDE
MGKFYSKIILLMLPAFAMGQLYIGNATATSYVYDNNEVIYVKQNIQLEGAATTEEGNLYLRGDGQLIQGLDNSAPADPETAINSGTGVISVFQQNSMNQWDYHYWASPVGDPINTENLINSETNRGNKRFYQSNDNGGGIYQPVSANTDEIQSNAIDFIRSFDSRIEGGAIKLSSYWLWKFVAKNASYSGWTQLNGSSLNPGEGYTMKGVGNGSNPTGQLLDFRGRPNNGTINVPVVAGGLTLVGNPYPSAMNLSFYLLSNSGNELELANCVGTSPNSGRKPINNSITGNAFFWESDPNVKSHYLIDYQGGYGTFTPGPCNSAGSYSPAVFLLYDNDGNVIGPRDKDANGDPDGNTDGETLMRHIAPIGQGFFVEGKTGIPANSVVTAKNEFRVFVPEGIANLSQFKDYQSKGKSNLKNPNLTETLRAGGQSFDDKGYVTLPKFHLNSFVNKTYNRSITAVMYDGSTMDVDLAMDGYNISGLKADISWDLESTERPIIINYFPYDIDAVLPLKIVGDKETNFYEFNITHLNFTPDESIYLHDKQSNEYHDILNSKYEFELPKGTYTDRFEITFKDGNKENLDLAEEVKESFAVYQNNGRAELTILNPLETELKDISVYDITGKLLVSKINEGTSNKVTIPSNTWSDGIYVVRVVTRDNVEYSKKVSVFNKK